MDVLLCEYSRPDLCIDCEKVYLIDVVDALAGELLDLVTVRVLERREAAHVKWLEEVRRVRWHTESDDVVRCAVLVELWGSVAAVAVKDKETIDSARTRRCMSVKVLHPLNAELICCPAIVAYCDYLVIR